MTTPPDYPKPPFARQTWPGQACRMAPPPDPGEASDIGSGRLAGRKTLIAGGETGPDA